MRPIRPILTVLAVLLLGGLQCSHAMGETTPAADDNAALDKTEPEKTKPRRGTGWFNHPKGATADEQMRIAQALEEHGRLWRAGRAYRILVYAWPDSPEAPQAQLAFARVLERRRKYAAAFDEYQYLIEFYAGQFPYEDVIESQFRVAHQRKNRDLYLKIVQNAPHWVSAAQAQFEAARLDEDDKEFADAIAEYQVVQNRYPGNELAPEAAFRECVCRVGMCRRLSPQDETAYVNARVTLSRFLRTYPNDRNVALAQEYLRSMEKQLAALMFAKAEFYDRRTHPRRAESALIAYKDFAKRFPASDRVEEARIRIANLEEEIADHEKSTAPP